jgi:hypothetical protein
MNIYGVSWVHGKCYGLSAVVVAPDEATAVELLELNPDDDSKITPFLLGVEVEASSEPWIVAHESL